ncbi:MAG: hypothetical protein Udaeo2_04940 [Candidatus Udaeobacter sp.]|nr:MAG: hypothetical protein Udaeo2_04940 [Candidatus Udaeobacter sp.]
MALGELRLRDWFGVVRKELLSGVARLILGTIGFFRITLWQYLHIFDYGKYHWLVALTVGTALVESCWGTLREPCYHSCCAVLDSIQRRHQHHSLLP